MSRTKLALTAAGAAVAAAVGGWALGVLFPRTSAPTFRHRTAWRTDRQWRSAARASTRLLKRTAARAAAELQHRKKQMMGAV